MAIFWELNFKLCWVILLLSVHYVIGEKHSVRLVSYKRYDIRQWSLVVESVDYRMGHISAHYGIILLFKSMEQCEVDFVFSVPFKTQFLRQFRPPSAVI